MEAKLKFTYDREAGDLAKNGNIKSSQIESF